MKMKHVAIVGIGCRFPGRVSDPEALWSLLSTGRDAIQEIPRDRFDADALYAAEAAPGRLSCRYGGFLDDIWGFDARFFNISPREAALIDPQHRLLLHTTWDALEDAGIPPSSLGGSTTGVFAALHLSEYAHLNPDLGMDLVGLTGSARNGLAGRIAYALNLFGPASVVDTDRSSGLVAIHQACLSISSGECDSAIVAGANLILRPDVSIAFSAAGMLSPDGRCKFADSSANGFVRSDGVATVVLRSLDVAVKCGNPIYAVIRGTAAQASGNPSGDMMTPSVEAQKRLIEQACKRAEISPSNLVFVEAHGTGTPVGDHAELAALDEVLRRDRRSFPCWVGSIKTNIGHCEAAAGLAGLIKAALVAHHRAIPASLHFRNFPALLHSKISAVQVATSLTPIPEDLEVLAGVSSFGLTGINAHAVLGEAPRAPADKLRPMEPQPGDVAVLPLSARHPAGLQKLAADLAVVLRNTSRDLHEICRSAATGRDHLEHRAAFVSRSREDLIGSLERFSKSADPGTAFLLGRANPKAHRKVVFVFPGQGSQWAGMGRGLMSKNQVFADTLRECDEVLRRIAGWSAVEELLGEPRLAQLDVVQPLLVIVEIALAAMWRSWGITPSAVVGCSMGEVAAAHVSGALSIEDALTIICNRSRLMKSVVGHGAMAVIDLPAPQVMAHFDHANVSLAAFNSPTSTVIAGDRMAVEGGVRTLEAKGIFAQLIRVDVASHSAQMDPILPDIQAALHDLRPRETTIPMYSTVTGGRKTGTELTAEYWARNVRLPVNLSDVIQLLLSEKHDAFIEMSAHPVLRSPLLDGVSHAEADALVLGTLKRDEDELQSALTWLATLHVNGGHVDWSNVLPKRAFGRLPTTPWNSSPYRSEATREALALSANAGGSLSTAGPYGHAAGPPPREHAQRAQVVEPWARSALSPAPAGLRVHIATEALRSELARILRVPAETIDPAHPFRDLGLSSLAGIEFRAAIGTLFGRTYASPLLFNYPNLQRLATHLCDELEARKETHHGEATLLPAGARASRGSDSSVATRSSEPIAIVGIAMRFPGGVTSGQRLWEVFRAGRDMVTEVPADRWDASAYYDPNPRTPAKMHTKWGAFVTDIGNFDPDFFGISPREAADMDPQQRLLLQLSWEAFENAGIPTSLVGGSATGVFVGMMNTNEYARRRAADLHLERVTPHMSTGEAMSVAAGRISYFYGLQGPALTVDTACSSSLTALHLAVSSLRLGECRHALVAGVNLIASPSTTMSFAKTRMLSPTGRCATFDASADGYVRGEGGCVLVLKPLSDALRDKDNVLATVRGSAINQDGRSSGLTAPNGKSQEAVIKSAMAAAGVTPSDVSYIEAHGTGTPLGDPIEVQAILDVFQGAHDITNPLFVGAAKANFGHLEACAGLLGVTKVILGMQHQEIPRQINLQRLNPSITLPDWLVIPREHQDWRQGRKKRVAGVSSFGFSGTNGHVIIEEAPSREMDFRRREHAVLCVSGRSLEGTQRVARELADMLHSEEEVTTSRLYDVAYSTACRREHLSYRAAFVVGTAEEMQRNLQSIADGKMCDGVFGPPNKPTVPKVAFMFTGHGGNYRGLGRTLYAAEEPFRQAFDRCAKIVSALTDIPEPASIFSDQPRFPSRMRDLQPVHFALQYALVEQWKEWGVTPTCVLGHGVGEYAAACAAGILDLESALRMLVSAGELIDNLTDPGIAAMVEGTPERVQPLLLPLSGRVTIAAYNAPEHLMVTGTEKDVRSFLATAECAGIRVKLLDGVPGVHSACMDPILSALERGAADASVAKPSITFASSVLGQAAVDEPTHSGYWSALVREPVRFSDAVYSLLAQGYNTFVEVGPPQSLLRFCGQAAGGAKALWVASLSSDQPPMAHTCSTLAQLFVAGLSIAWRNFYRGNEGRFQPLPSYPFARQRFWQDAPAPPPIF